MDAGRKIPKLDAWGEAVVDEKKDVVPGDYTLESVLKAEVNNDGPITYEFQIQLRAREIRGEELTAITELGGGPIILSRYVCERFKVPIGADPD